MTCAGWLTGGERSRSRLGAAGEVVGPDDLDLGVAHGRGAERSAAALEALGGRAQVDDVGQSDIADEPLDVSGRQLVEGIGAQQHAVAGAPAGGGEPTEVADVVGALQLDPSDAHRQLLVISASRAATGRANGTARRGVTHM